MRKTARSGDRCRTFTVLAVKMRQSPARERFQLRSNSATKLAAQINERPWAAGGFCQAQSPRFAKTADENPQKAPCFQGFLTSGGGAAQKSDLPDRTSKFGFPVGGATGLHAEKSDLVDRTPREAQELIGEG